MWVEPHCGQATASVGCRRTNFITLTSPAPLPQVRFCPTGGIGMKNAPDYLSSKNILCVGGSWVAPKAAILAGDWAEVTRLAAEAAALPRG